MPTSYQDWLGPGSNASSESAGVQFKESSFTYGSNKTLSYLSAGPSNGPLLIFMHGWPAIGLLWHPQTSVFAGLGFHVVAPDMPGYGKSSHDKGNYSDYSIESNVNAMLALLRHLKQPSAVWVGHDWGTGPLWGLAAVHPEVCRAIVGMTVPYRSLDLGLEEEVKLVNRDLYPKDRYPYGQWSYQKYYEDNFDDAVKWFESSPGGIIKALYSKGDPKYLTEPFTAAADVVRDGGWFGGGAQGPPEEAIPDEAGVLEPEMRKTLVEAMKKTGWWAANSWYMNHNRNREYMLTKAANNGRLEMPVLFIEALYDAVCATATSDLAKPMREYTKDLTFVSIKAGHSVELEKPAETNAAIAKWLVEKVGDWWPEVDVKN